MTLNAGSRPSTWAYSRSSRLPTAWKVPDHIILAASGCTRRRGASASAARAIRSARSVSSRAARRVKVSSAMRSGATPWSSSQATRWARVLVLPVPAPAMISSGSDSKPAARPAAAGTARPNVAARRWASFRPSPKVSGAAAVPMSTSTVIGPSCPTPVRNYSIAHRPPATPPGRW